MLVHDKHRKNTTLKLPGDVGLGTESEPLSRDGLSGLVAAIMGVIYPLHRKL
jgi:hypothetical protein